MTSSATSAIRSRKGLILISILLVVFVALYTTGWIYIADRVETRAKADLANLTAQGTGVDCESLHTDGYPLRINVVCESISWQKPALGVSFQAGRLSSGFAAYAPQSLSNNLIGPAFIAAPGLEPLEINWSSFTSSARLARPMPTNITLAARDLNIAQRTEPSANTSLSTPLTSLEQVHLELSGLDGPLRLMARFAGLKFTSAVLGNAKSPEIDGAADIEFSDAKTLFDNRNAPINKQLYGQSGLIKQALLSLPNGAMMTLTGPFSIDESGQINAALKITLVNTPALAQAAQTLFPQQGGNIATLMFALSAMPKDATGNPTLDIAIRNGKVSAGFIPLGRLPAL